jgi:exopolysaccharide production protein ExoZ
MKVRLNIIQALRGLAALIVVIHHASASSLEYFSTPLLNNYFRVGWNAVDFFFVLSGFIMVFVHFNDLRNKTNAATFFKKRFIRIYPIYWVLATVSLGFFLISGRVSNEEWSISYIIKSYLLIRSNEAPFLGVAWSLIFEVFFYIVFGIGIMCGYKIMRVFVPLWLLIIILVNSFQLEPFASFFFLNNFIIEFLFGCITGYIYHIYLFKISDKGLILFFLGLAMFLLMWGLSLSFNVGAKDALESRLIYGTASSLLILGAALLDTKKPFNVSKRFLMLGDSSYSIYLLHPLVLAFVYKLTSYVISSFNNSIWGAFGIGVFAVFLSLYLGFIFHNLIEKRLLLVFNELIFVKKRKSLKVNLVLKK